MPKNSTTVASTQKKLQMTQKLETKLAPTKKRLTNVVVKLCNNQMTAFKPLHIDFECLIECKNNILALEKEGLRDYYYRIESRLKNALKGLIQENPKDSVLNNLHQLVMNPGNSVQSLYESVNTLAQGKPYFEELRTAADVDRLAQKEGKLPEIALLLRVVIDGVNLVFTNCSRNLKNPTLSDKDIQNYHQLLIKIIEVSLELLDYNLHENMGLLVLQELFENIYESYKILQSPENIPNRRFLIDQQHLLLCLTTSSMTEQSSFSELPTKNENAIIQKSTETVVEYVDQLSYSKELIYQKLQELAKLASMQFDQNKSDLDDKSLYKIIESFQDILYENYFRSNRSRKEQEELIQFYSHLLTFSKNFPNKKIEMSYMCYADLITSVIEPNIASFKRMTEFLNALFSKMKKQQTFTLEDRAQITRIFSALIAIIEPVSQQFDTQNKIHGILRNNLFVVTQRIIERIVQHNLRIEHDFLPILKFFYAHRNYLSSDQISNIKNYPEQFKGHFARNPKTFEEYNETYLQLLKLILVLPPHQDLSTARKIYEMFAKNDLASYLGVEDNTEPSEINFECLESVFSIKNIQSDLIYFLTKADVETLVIDDVIYFLNKVSSFEVPELKKLFFNLMKKNSSQNDISLIQFFEKYFYIMVTDVTFLNYVFHNTKAHFFIKENVPRISITQNLILKSIDVYKEYNAFLTLRERRQEPWITTLYSKTFLSPKLKAMILLLDNFFISFGEDNQLVEYLPSEQLSQFSLFAKEMDRLIAHLVRLQEEHPDLFLSYVKSISSNLRSNPVDMDALLNSNNRIAHSIQTKKNYHFKLEKQKECQAKLVQAKHFLSLKKYKEALQIILETEVILGADVWGLHGNAAIALLTPEELNQLYVMKGDCFYYQFDMNAALRDYLMALKYPVNKVDQITKLKFKMASSYFSTKSYFNAICVIDGLNRMPHLSQTEKLNLKLLKFKSLLALNALPVAEKFLLENFKNKTTAEYCFAQALLANKQKKYTEGFSLLCEAFQKKPSQISYFNLLVKLYQEKHLDKIIPFAEKVLSELTSTHIKFQLEIKILMLKKQYKEALQRLDQFNEKYRKKTHLVNFDRVLCYYQLDQKMEALECLKTIKFSENKSTLSLFVSLCYELNQPQPLTQKIYEACHSCIFLEPKQYQVCIEYCFKIGQEETARYVLNHALTANAYYPNKFDLSLIVKCFEKNKQLMGTTFIQNSEPVNYFSLLISSAFRNIEEQEYSEYVDDAEYPKYEDNAQGFLSLETELLGSTSHSFFKPNPSEVSNVIKEDAPRKRAFSL